MLNYSFDIKEQSEKSLSEGIVLTGETGIDNIEISACINGIFLWEMNGREIEAIRDEIIDSGKIICLITLDRDIGYEETKRFFRAAHLLGARNIKLPGELSQESLEEKVKIAASFNIRPLIENSAEGRLKTDDDLAALKDSLGESELGIIFNPAEFVKLQHHPFFHMFYRSHLKNDIVFLRVTDSLYSGGYVPLAQGNCEIKELISILMARSFNLNGYFSINDRDSDGGAKLLSDMKKLVKLM